MPTPPKADEDTPDPANPVDPLQAGPVSKPLKTRLADLWRRCKPKLRFVMSGDGERWLPMRLWLHIALFFGLAVAAIFVLWAIFEGVFSPSLDDPLKVEVIRLILFIIAGIGGVFALVIAYRRQGLNEAAEVRIERSEAREDGKVFNERFKSAAEQLSSERAANRLAGVYAMAGLADDWATGRQTCINVLCAYLRMPYDAPGEIAPPETTDGATSAEDSKEHKERRQEQQVRHTIINVIGERLRAEPIEGRTWHGHDFDFTEAHFDGGNLSRIQVTGGTMEFRGVVFSVGQVDFTQARFSAGQVSFAQAIFSGGMVDLTAALFSGGRVNFASAEFSGGQLDFSSAIFSGGQVDFIAAKFSGGSVDFRWTEFYGGLVDFERAEFSGGQVDFRGAVWDQPPNFDENYPLRPGLSLPDSEWGADDKPQ